MFRVCKGQKIRNVKVGDNIKILQALDAIPEDYVIPESYIKCGIVEEVPEEKKRFKTREAE